MAGDSDPSWDDDTEAATSFDDSAVTDQQWADGVDTLLFTAGNPQETVSVTSLMSGQPISVELSSAAARMTERELRDEILAAATISRKQALASQHVLIGRFMDRLGHDPVGTRSFLENELGLPSPEAVRDARAQAFSASLHHELD